LQQSPDPYLDLEEGLGPRDLAKRRQNRRGERGWGRRKRERKGKEVA